VKAVYGLGAGDGIQISSPRQRDLAVGQKLKVARHFASGSPHPFSHSLYLAQMGGIEGEDSIRLPQLGLFDNDGFGLIISWLGHFRLSWFD